VGSGLDACSARGFDREGKRNDLTPVFRVPLGFIKKAKGKTWHRCRIGVDELWAGRSS